MFRFIPALVFTALLAVPTMAEMNGLRTNPDATDASQPDSHQGSTPRATRMTIHQPRALQGEDSRRFFVKYRRGMRNSMMDEMLTMVTSGGDGTSPDNDGYRLRKLSEGSDRMRMLYDFGSELDTFVISTASSEEMAALANSDLVEYLEEDVPRYLVDESGSGGSNSSPFSLTDEQRAFRSMLGENRPGTQHVPPGVEQIHAPFMWEQGYRGEEVTVCVIDSGINKDHVDFGGPDQLSGFLDEDFFPWFVDPVDHGTAVSGIIGAQDNDIGIVGVAPKARLHIVNFGLTFARISQGNFTFSSDIIQSLLVCRDAGARVVNLSLGSPVYVRAEHRAFRQATDRDEMLVVASSGNTGNIGNFPSYPAAYGTVVSVGAVDSNKQILPLSTSNNLVDLVAPGLNVISPVRSDLYDFRSGTSFSSPHVAGAAALLMSAFPSARAKKIRRNLQLSAEDLGPSGRDEFYGFGFVNVERAFNRIRRV